MNTKSAWGKEFGQPQLVYEHFAVCQSRQRCCNLLYYDLMLILNGGGGGGGGGGYMHVCEIQYIHVYIAIVSVFNYCTSTVEQASLMQSSVMQ